MATVTNRLAFLISANADQAIRAFDKTAVAADRQLGKAQNSIDKLGGSLTKFGAAGLAAAGTLGSGLYKMAQGAIEDQRSQALLAQQLKNSTGATKEQITEVERIIDSMARASGIADDKLRPAYGNLARSTGDLNVAQDLLNVSMDISRATGRDLETVTIAIGRAAQGQFGSLSRLGIPLDDATKKSKDFSVVLDVLTKQFGGQAAAYAETYAGKMERTKVAVDEAKEAIGTGFVPIIENVSNALSKGATGFSKLDTATGGAIGSFASYGVAALGVLSTTSLVAGQMIKFRTNLMDADGQLSNLGKTAKIASIGLGALAVADLVGTAVMELGGFARETEARLNKLLGVLGDSDDPKRIASDFANLADQLKNSDKSFLGFGALVKQTGKAIRVAGADTDAGRIAIEYLDEAFGNIAAKSPALAQKIIDALYQQSLQLDRTGQTYKDNMMLVARYQKQLTGQRDATDAVSKAEISAAKAAAEAAAATRANTNATTANSDAKTKAEERARKLADAQEKLKDKVMSAADALRNQLTAALDDAKARLAKATDEFNNYKNSISNSITGTISFASAQQLATQNVEALNIAVKENADAQQDVAFKSNDTAKAQSNVVEKLGQLRDAQILYNKAVEAKDAEEIASTYNKLTQAQAELSDANNDLTKTQKDLNDASVRLTETQNNLLTAQQTPKTFFNSLKKQEFAATTFANNLQKLLDLGAQQGLIDQLAASGAEAGNAIASEILSSADPVQYVNDVNTIIANTQSIADRVGTSSASRFRQAGVDSATALVNGMNSILSQANIDLTFKNLDKVGTPLKTLADLTANVKNQVLDLYKIAGAEIPASFGGGEASPIAPNFPIPSLGGDWQSEFDDWVARGMPGFAVDMTGTPLLADGGIVKATPGGTLALIGEGGQDEAVIPLPNKGGIGGTNYITINVNGGDPNAVVDALRRYYRQNGNIPVGVAY